jgi:hypothetical protein
MAAEPSTSPGWENLTTAPAEDWDSVKTINGTVFDCGSVEAQGFLDREDRSYFGFVLLVFFVAEVLWWTTFGVWHGVTKCAYWRGIKQRQIYETRLHTGCRRISAVDQSVRRVCNRGVWVGGAVWWLCDSASADTTQLPVRCFCGCWPVSLRKRQLVSPARSIVTSRQCTHWLA